MNNTIEQSLVEIEKNLEKLESARQQVNKVTQSSNELAQGTVGLIKEFKKIADVLNGQSGTFGTKLQQSETNFQKKIEELLLKWQKEIDTFLESIDKTNAKYRNNLDKSAENSFIKSKEILAQHEKFLIQNDEILKDFHGALDAFKVRLEQFDFGKLLLPLDKKIEKLENSLNAQKNIIIVFLVVIIILGLANLFF